jgi:hypothetical protein
MQLEQLPDHSVKVSMEAKIDTMLQKRQITGTSNNPSDMNLFINNDEEGKDFSANATDFKSQTYELMYFDKVRIDIKKECGVLASLSNNPGEDSYRKLHKLQNYLKKTKDYYIILGSDDPIINIYTDAGYAQHADGKSQSGIYITLGKNGGPILVKSFKQKLVTNSTSEAELLAMVDGIKRAIPLMKIMEELSLNDNSAILQQDNMSTISIAKKGEGASGKSKHFRIRHEFVKDMIEYATLKPQHCPSEKTIADFLTKPMTGSNFKKQIRRAMINE